MRLSVYLVTTALSIVAAVPAAAGETCVKNASQEHRLFAVEAEGDRISRWLKAGETLCLRTTREPGRRAVVSVFEHTEVIEGCSRLSATGELETLIRYVDFDRCAWLSNS
jgi:hypothetical protein